MTTTDITLTNTALLYLSSLINKRLKKYRSDPFLFKDNTVFKSVNLYINNHVISLQNEISTIFYYGQGEEIAKLDISISDSSVTYSHLSGVQQIDYPINKVISDIQVVNRTCVLYKDKHPAYEMSWTKGIIFVFPDMELGFERLDDFSEQIAIWKGTKVLSKFIPLEKECTEFEEGYTVKYEQTVLSLLGL